MNKYLVAIYQGKLNQLDHLLSKTNNHEYHEINAALAVVLQDTDRDVVERLCLVESMLVAGADPNSRGLDKDPLLCRVCTQGEEALVRLLLEYACNVNACNESDRKTPLHVAAGKGNEEVVRMLIESGASTNAVDVYGDTPLMDMLYCDNSDMLDLTNITRLLLVDCNHINSGNMNQLTPLHIAAATDKHKPVELLLSAGSSVQMVDLFGETCLFPATQFASLNTVSLLLNAGASVNVANKDGNTPIHKAVMCQRHDLLEAFLDHGANLDAENNRGNCPLITALETNNIKAVQCLIQNNCRCDVTAYLPKSSSNQDFFTGSALQLALCKEQWVSAQMLVIAGSQHVLADLNKLSTAALGRLSLDDSEQETCDAITQRKLLLKNLLETPMSLRHMCRIVIRKSLNKAERFTSAN